MMNPCILKTIMSKSRFLISTSYNCILKINYKTQQYLFHVWNLKRIIREPMKFGRPERVVYESAAEFRSV